MNTLLLTLANMGVNLDDVADVVNNCIPQLIFFGVVVAAAIIVLIAMAVNKKLAKPTKFMVRAQSGLAVLLAFGIMLNLVAFGPMSTMLDLVTGNGTITEESSDEANALCTEIAEEGIVLLQNDDNELPLASGSNLNVFGWASVGPVYGGTGAGAISADRPTVSLLDGLHNAGINTNTELSDFYTAYCAERPALGYSNHNWTLPEPTAASYTQELIDNAKSFSDTAMVVISRVGGEFADLPTDMSTVNYTDNSTEYKDFEDGQHYLSLSKTERDMIDLVCSNFDNVVLVYNAANTLELGFVDEHPQIKSVIWCPGTGQTGFNALGEIVAGEVNPPGHSADTFVYDLTAAPYFNNIGAFAYTNADSVGYTAAGLFGRDPEQVPPHFVNYVEGIYVGYKFYETAAAEGLIDYDKTVQYPFGHGLSYTTFTIPFSVWLLLGFLNDLPMSLEEAALVDGCNRGSAFVKIILPILGPCLVATGVYIFMTSWNEYTFAMMFTNTDTRTIPVALKSLIGQLGVQWDLLTAGGIITIIPVCIMFFFAQKRLVEGLTAGAVKG